jgi:hypothetical protein
MRTWRAPDEASMLLPLVICLLFVCIEFLLDDEATSQMHIRQGRRLLTEMTELLNQDSLIFATVKSVLVPIYTRLSLASYTMGSNPDPIPTKFKRPSTLLSLSTSREEQRQIIFEIADAGFHFGSEARRVINTPKPDQLEIPRLDLKQKYLLSELEMWYHYFLPTSSLSAQAQTRTNNDHDRDFLLLLYNIVFVWISTALSPHETAYDAYLSSFYAVVQLASAILQASENYAIYIGAFIFETKLIPALYWVVTKCRHAEVRRDALQLLLHPLLTARRENLWDALESYAVSKRIMEVEEWHAARHATGMDASKIDGPIPLPETVGAKDTVEVIKKEAGFASSEHPRESDAQSPEALPKAPDADSDVAFGIPESCRVKFGVVGPRDKIGTWLTIYIEAGEGVGRWRSGKDYVRWVKQPK